ncbi:MAG: glycosyltransferase [Archangiaceae bacterium]|nr:glycosyltransferase [Archangiaceae bacterium]
MTTRPDVLCLPPCPWDDGAHRTAQLMTRYARTSRVYWLEEAVFHHGDAELEICPTGVGPMRVTPLMPMGTAPHEVHALTRRLLDALLRSCDVQQLVLWYATPAALPVTRQLDADLVVYDTLDAAHPSLDLLEKELLGRADVVFTTASRRGLHPASHVFPSSVDARHFARARWHRTEPEDQRCLPGKRLGYCGVVDERVDLELVAELARLAPDWQLVMVGPLALDEASLPRAPNLHWLGDRPYDALPDYLSGWDVAMLPLRSGEGSTVPALLASGRPVVATRTPEVADPYGRLDLVKMADGALGLLAAAEALSREGDALSRLRRGDAFLAATSFDSTWQRMSQVLDDALERRHATAARAA